jgi:radical SAM protein with 4Fe4S-binding SPASM domain
MVAKEHPRIRLEGRTDLSKAIPLDTPIHLFIDPSSSCNFACKFCFNHHEAFHNIMPFDLFKKVINDCKQFPHKIKALRLYGFGDPLLNKKLPEMVWYAKHAGVTDFVEFTTNGWWLSPVLNLQLIVSGLDAITISVPAITEDKIKDVCGRNVDFAKYVGNIKHFYKHRNKCRVHVKLTNYDLTDGEIRKFKKIFSNFADEISIDNIVPIWNGMDNQMQREPDKNIYMRPIEEVSVCPYIFYHMTIHANGDVSTCFVDWQHKNVIGDVKTQSLVDIWNGAPLKYLRIEQLNGIKDGICNGCGQLKYGMADDIGDPQKILERIR